MIIIVDKIPMMTTTEGNFNISKTELTSVRDLIKDGCVNNIQDPTLKAVVEGTLGVNVGPTISVTPRLHEDTVIIVNVTGVLPTDATVLPLTCRMDFSILRAGIADRAVHGLKGLLRKMGV